MGIREIYLLGVDFEYKEPKKYDGTFGTRDHNVYYYNGEKNHFHPDYLKPGDRSFAPGLHLHEKAYLAADRALKKVGGKIYNATRGGKLEIFSRVHLERVLHE